MENKIDELKEWRHIIPDPQCRVYLDKWLGKFAVVEKKIYYANGMIKQINSTNYKVGAGNSDFDSFIDWANGISYYDLPDQVITHEIMNEIDVNMLELKTKREKDMYLTKLSEVLKSISNSFKKYTKTHPDYVPLEEDIRYNEETDEIYYVEMQKEINLRPWRELNKDLSNRDIENPILTEAKVSAFLAEIGLIID